MTNQNRPSINYRVAGGLLKAALTMLVVFLALSGFTGCSPAVIVTVAPETSNTGNAAFAAEISPTAETLVRRFTGTGTPIFDKAEITKSLTAAGFKINSLDFPGTAGIALTLTVPELNGLLNKSVSVLKAEKYG